MSDLIWNETPVNNEKKYNKNDWMLYSIHDDKNIKGFFGIYRFLSNFYECPVYFDGKVYPSSENAYQAAKLDRSVRNDFITITPLESKRLWKKYDKKYVLPNWDENKYRIMDIILLDKFTRNGSLKKLLLETGEKYLEETNHWKDTYWGVYNKTNEGENNLGKILMNIRSYLISS